MESLVLSPASANQDLIPNLIAVSASPRNVTSNQSIWNYSVCTGEVIHSVEYFCHSEDVTLPKTIHSLLETSLSHPFLPMKNLLFWTAVLSSFQLARWDAAWLMNHWIKPIRSLSLFSWILFLRDSVAVAGPKETSNNFGDNEKHRCFTLKPTAFSFSPFPKYMGKFLLVLSSVVFAPTCQI